MTLVRSLAKGNKTTCGHLSDALITVVLSALNYGNLIHVVPDRSDIEDSIKSGEWARRAVSKTLEVKIKGRETHLQDVFDEQQEQIKLKSIPHE